MKVKLISILLILIFCVVPFTYKWWPSGKVQDYAILIAHSDDFLSLYEYSTTTNFESIFWCKDDLQNTFRRNGRTLTEVEAESDIEVGKFLAYASFREVPCFHASEYKRGWLIHASKDARATELNGKPAMSQIARFYYHSKSTNEPVCNERGSENSKLLHCSHHMFSGWYMLEETMTYLLEDVTGDDI
jgi:hypothetical protein